MNLFNIIELYYAVLITNVTQEIYITSICYNSN